MYNDTARRPKQDANAPQNVGGSLSLLPAAKALS